MPTRPAVAIAIMIAVGVYAAPAAAAPKSTATLERAAATDMSAQRRARRAAQIVVTPSSRLYRKCVDWYALERRPSGPVITPRMRCQWALR
jgi:hypothetical protein